MLFPAFLVILLAAATPPALSAQRAQAAVPANAELHLFPLEPEKELGSGWRAKLGLMPDRLTSITTTGRRSAGYGRPCPPARWCSRMRQASSATRWTA